MPINTLPGRFELLFELPHTESRMESWNGILHQKGGKKKNMMLILFVGILQSVPT